MSWKIAMHNHHSDRPTVGRMIMVKQGNPEYVQDHKYNKRYMYRDWQFSKDWNEIELCKVREGANGTIELHPVNKELPAVAAKYPLQYYYYE